MIIVISIQYLDQELVMQSINYQLLKDGFAYPTFYDGMFYDLRSVFAEATTKVRAQRKGIWSVDRTNIDTEITTLDDITEQFILMPKVFRRMVTYIKENREKVLILSQLHFTYLDDLFDVNNITNEIRLTQLPENLVFLGFQ